MTPHPPADEQRPPDGAARPDASMTLLREIMERPRDPAYAEVAERRADGTRGRSWFQEIVVLLLTIAIGTGGVWAARQLRAPVDSALQARTVLEEQIRDRSAVTDSLSEDIAELRAEIGELEGHLNSPADEIRSREAEIAGAHAGTIPVSGPAIEIELTEPAQLSTPEEHVLDFDIQLVVNSLWAAGAEAISVNDRRLAYGTAIRSAGEAILVDLEPVKSPYRIVAIGEPDRLTRSFSDTPGASHLKLLHSNFRIGSSITQHPRVDMAAGNAMRLNYAEPEANLAEGDHGTLKGEE